MKRRALALWIVTMLVGVGALPAGCAGSHPVEIEPRYIAVHNALAAMGLVQIGPIQQGSLAEGREMRLPLELPAQCATVIAIGRAGVRDLDVTLLDPEDKAIAHNATRDAQSVVHACPEKGGRFTLVVRMARGAGEFIAASWVSGTSGQALAPAPPGFGATSGAAGTCEAPIPLVAGSITGNTRRGEAEHAGGCGNSDAKELVYKLDVPRRQRVTIEVEPSNFDSVLYVRKDECADKEAEVSCNDDVSTGGKRSASAHGSRIDEVYDPGTYWVFVDGYNSEVGSFRMNVQIADVPTLADACRKASLLTQKTSGTITGAFNHATGSCDHGKGPDAIHRFDVRQRARVRIVLHSDDFSPVIHVRKTCVDDRSEIGCTDTGAKPEEAAFVAVLDPGAYTVFADSGDKSARGRYAIDADLALENGSGVRGDACGDAIPLALNDKSVEGDTFEARDDFAGRCTASGAPDVVYRFEVAKRSRVTAKLGSEEGDHVFVLSKSCTDRTSELACGPILDEVLAPGVYWLAVDGTAKGLFGRYSFQLRGKDVTLQESACRSPSPLVLGQTVTGTTVGAGDRFIASCAGREDAQTSADRVFKLVLPARTHIQLLLSTPNHDGVLAIRRSCIDPPQMKSVRTAEVACNNDGPDNRHSKLDATLDAGTYYVVVDGHQGTNEGTFTLEAKTIK